VTGNGGTVGTDKFYRSELYIGRGRLYSYANQLASIIEMTPESVLEIGKGSGYVQETLARFGFDVTTADLYSELAPDIVADVRDIPVPDAAFDVVSCCQVLEHLPFVEFRTALMELRRVARRRLVVSLPDVSRDVEAMIRVPKLGERRIAVSLGLLARDKPEVLPGRPNHHWEIGFRGTQLAAVKNTMREAGWHIKRTWRVPEYRWHRFFILE
jgi:SAM-dependent methyltransferase